MGREDRRRWYKILIISGEARLEKTENIFSKKLVGIKKSITFALLFWKRREITERIDFALGGKFIDIMKHSQEKEQQANPLSI